jgi:hypothetical protein
MPTVALDTEVARWVVYRLKHSCCAASKHLDGYMRLNTATDHATAHWRPTATARFPYANQFGDLAVHKA